MRNSSKRNSFVAGQLLRFTHIKLGGESRPGFQLNYDPSYTPTHSPWPGNYNPRYKRRWCDYERRVLLPVDSVMLFVSHCPGIRSNWDRTPGTHIDHQCIYVEYGHAIVLLDEKMFQVPYSYLRRLTK